MKELPMVCRPGWMKHVSAFSELQLHGELMAQELASYDCELEMDNSN